MSKNNGGPAFPVSTGSTVDQESGVFGHQSGGGTWQFPGMTLHAYYAGKAMQGLLAGRVYNPGHAEQIAKDSKTIADAMIAARGDV